ncbi:MAG: hypothetical protein IT379_18610, partial [Deltaproteobacteria bacterium]|nr:hypothetical protein [Deltaproteobacteria bacterium]
GVELSSATYVLRFDREGLDPLETRGFALRTDRGYDVRLTGAYFLQHSVSLVDCQGVTDELALLSTSIARAGHSDAPDPSRMDRPIIVDLVEASAEIELGSVSFPPRRYCRVHHLVGGSTEHLLLRGSFRARAGDDWRHFRVVSSLAWGDLVELDPSIAHGAPGRHARVVVERSIGRMLDGIELSDAEPFDVELARQALRNLVGHAAISVTLEPP